MSAPDRSSTAGVAYLDLRKLAAKTSRPTDELHQLYALEGFLHRLTLSPHRSSSCSREASSSRPTPTGGQLETSTWPDFNHAPTSNRSEQQSSKSRPSTSMTGSSSTSNKSRQRPSETTPTTQAFGQRSPDGSPPQSSDSTSTSTWATHSGLTPNRSSCPDSSTRHHSPIAGYRAELILAEKIVTALQRGTANTRWRDFVDIATLAHTSIDTATLAEAVTRVAEHRETSVEPLAEVLDGYAALAQPKWSAWRRKQQLGNTPADFQELLASVIDFADQILTILQESSAEGANG